MIITDGSARLSHIFYAALVCTLNIVAKWEECVRSQCNICIFIQPCAFLFCCKYRWFYFEDILPSAICKYIHVLNAESTGAAQGNRQGTRLWWDVKDRKRL